MINEFLILNVVILSFLSNAEIIINLIISYVVLLIWTSQDNWFSQVTNFYITIKIDIHNRTTLTISKNWHYTYH